jgi:hypothetical protein
MCLLCIELQKGAMRAPDLARNFGELVDTDPKHAEEVAEKYGDVISESIFKEEDVFNELDFDPFFYFDD